MITPLLGDDKQAIIDECHSKVEAKYYDSVLPVCKQAAEQGDVVSLFNLGLMFDLAKARPKDNIMAYVWYNIASAQREEKAKKIEILLKKKCHPVKYVKC